MPATAADIAGAGASDKPRHSADPTAGRHFRVVVAQQRRLCAPVSATAAFYLSILKTLANAFLAALNLPAPIAPVFCLHNVSKL